MKRLALFLLTLPALMAVPQQATFSSAAYGFVTLSGSPYSGVTSFRLEGRPTAWVLPAGRAIIWSMAGGGIYVAIKNDGSGNPLLQVSDFLDTCSGGCELDVPIPSVGADFVYRVTKDASAALLTSEVWKVDGSGYTFSQKPLTAVVTTGGVAGVLQIGDSVSIGTQGFLRWFSTIVSIGSKAPFGGAAGDLLDLEFTGSNTTLLVDSSANVQNVTLTSGSVSYSAAPKYNPACVVSSTISLAASSFVAGTPIPSFTGANSFPLNGTNTLSSFGWDQVNDAPSLATPSSVPFFSVTPPSTLSYTASAVNPTFTGTVSNGYSYVIRLTVFDSDGASSQCTAKFGVTPVGSDRSVTIPNAKQAQQLGKFLPLNQNQNPSYALSEIAYANLQVQKLAGTNLLYPNTGTGAHEFIDYWNVSAAGTITAVSGQASYNGTAVTWVSGPQYPLTLTGVVEACPSNVCAWYTISSVNSATSITLTSSASGSTVSGFFAASQIIGSGTSFKAAYCGGSVGTSVNVAGQQPLIWIWYPVTQGTAQVPSATYPGGTFGRALWSVLSCQSDTALTLAGSGPGGIDAFNRYNAISLAGGAGLSYAVGNYQNNLPGGVGSWYVNSGYPGNYYDNVKALYAIYFQTGIDDYLYWAQVMADRWWTFPAIDRGAVYDGTRGNQAFVDVRSMALGGLYLRAADTFGISRPYSYYPGLAVIANYWTGYNVSENGTCGFVGPTLPCFSDIRGNSFETLYVSYDALFNPNATQALQSAQAVDNDIIWRWGAMRQPAGNWLMWDTSNYSSWANNGSSPNPAYATATVGSPYVAAPAGNFWTMPYYSDGCSIWEGSGAANCVPPAPPASGAGTMVWNLGNPPTGAWFIPKASLTNPSNPNQTVAVTAFTNSSPMLATVATVPAWLSSAPTVMIHGVINNGCPISSQNSGQASLTPYTVTSITGGGPYVVHLTVDSTLCGAGFQQPVTNAEGDAGWYYAIPIMSTITAFTTGTTTPTITLGTAMPTLAIGSYVSIGRTGCVGLDGVMFTVTSTSPLILSGGTTVGCSTSTTGLIYDATKIQLSDINGNPVNFVSGFACPSGSCSVGWEMGGLLGGGTQVFMVGIQAEMFYFAQLTIAAIDPTNAALIPAWLAGLASWMTSTGLNTQVSGSSFVNGVYYGRGFVSCEPPSTADPFCDDGVAGDRPENGEALNVATFARLANPTTAAILTLGDTMMDALWSWNPGEPGYDGLAPSSVVGFPNAVAASGSPGTTGGFYFNGAGGHKWFGYFMGMGGNWAWSYAQLNVGATGPVRGTGVISGGQIATFRPIPLGFTEADLGRWAPLVIQ